MSHGPCPRLALRRRNSPASDCTTSVSFSEIPQRSKFDSTSEHIFRERSTNVVCAAPRDSASIPTAPEPAQRSRKRAPSIRGVSTLNRVSRSRSEVGRTCMEGGLLRFLPRYLPAIIRTCCLSQKKNPALPRRPHLLHRH